MKKEARAKYPARRAMALAFWDASALCCFQPQSQRARYAARILRQVVWWGTAIEMVSAFQRAKRQGKLRANEADESLARLQYLREDWHEIEHSDSIRSQAERILAIHNLRAADALQLSAALIWCDKLPKGRAFVCADERVASAAEGFNIVRL